MTSTSPPRRRGAANWSTGDRISGPVRAARRSERHPSLVRIDTINGVAAERGRGRHADRRDRGRLPDRGVRARWRSRAGRAAAVRARLAGPDRRPVALGPQRAGGSHRRGARGRRRPRRRAARRRRAPRGALGAKDVAHATATGLSFAASADAQEAAVEQAAERGRRIALRGGNAVLLIDTLDGLGSGAARRTMAAARNLRGAGSLSVVATARASLGGESDADHAVARRRDRSAGQRHPPRGAARRHRPSRSGCASPVPRARPRRARRRRTRPSRRRRRPTRRAARTTARSDRGNRCDAPRPTERSQPTAGLSVKPYEARYATRPQEGSGASSIGSPPRSGCT